MVGLLLPASATVADNERLPTNVRPTGIVTSVPVVLRLAPTMSALAGMDAVAVVTHGEVLCVTATVPLTVDVPLVTHGEVTWVTGTLPLTATVPVTAGRLLTATVPLTVDVPLVTHGEVT
jgi:hypothetical protein